MAKRGKVAVWLVTVGLGVGAVVAAAAVWDPRRAEVETAFLAYLGDLRTMRGASASLRVLPDDLVALKEAALRRASEYPTFRDEAMAFMGVADASELAAVPKGRFFEFLLDRTFAAHPEVHSAITRGTVIGIHVDRSGAEAEVEATLALGTAEGRRNLVMRVSLVEVDGEWLVRL